MRSVIVYREPNRAGCGLALVSMVAALGGIFTAGVVLVPIAVLFMLLAYFQAIVHFSSRGLAHATVAAVLVVIGFLTSPVLQLVVLGAVVLGHG